LGTWVLGLSFPEEEGNVQKSSLEEWRAQGDDFRTFLEELVSSLPQFEPAGGMIL